MAHCLFHNLSGEPYGYDLTQLNANSPPTWVVGGVKASNQQDDMITFQSSNGVDWTRKLNSNKNNRFPGLGCAMALLEYVSRSCALHLHNTRTARLTVAASAACWCSGTMWAIGGVEDDVYNNDVYSSTAGNGHQQTWQHVARACSHHNACPNVLTSPPPSLVPSQLVEPQEFLHRPHRRLCCLHIINYHQLS